jgi:WW domain
MYGLLQTRHLIAGAATDWIEVRDATAGEVWYYNPSTGESQWQRPAVLIGIVPSPERVRQLPALAASSGSSPNRQQTTTCTGNSSSTASGSRGSRESPQEVNAGSPTRLVSPCITDSVMAHTIMCSEYTQRHWCGAMTTVLQSTACASRRRQALVEHTPRHLFCRHGQRMCIVCVHYRATQCAAAEANSSRHSSSAASVAQQAAAHYAQALSSFRWRAVGQRSLDGWPAVGK